MTSGTLPDPLALTSTRFDGRWLDDPDFSPHMLYKAIGYALTNFPDDANFMVSRNAPVDAPQEIWLQKQAVALGCLDGLFYAVIAAGDRRITFGWQGNNWLDIQVDTWGELRGLPRKLSMRMKSRSFQRTRQSA